jgi:micrococcal nuclease
VYVYSARLIKVVDGDTLDLLVDLGFSIHLKQRVRLLGVNCPEHGTIEGNDATAYTQAWITQYGPDLILRTILDKTEKYGRVLGTVMAGPRILNDDLVTSGHAVGYNGGKRTPPAQPGEPGAASPVR